MSPKRGQRSGIASGTRRRSARRRVLRDLDGLDDGMRVVNGQSQAVHQLRDHSDRHDCPPPRTPQLRAYLLIQHRSPRGEPHGKRRIGREGGKSTHTPHISNLCAHRRDARPKHHENCHAPQHTTQAMIQHSKRASAGSSPSLNGANLGCWISAPLAPPHSSLRPTRPRIALALSPPPLQRVLPSSAGGKGA